MRLAALIFFAWTATAAGVALALGRLLWWLDRRRPQPWTSDYEWGDEDWLADAPCDCWPQVRYDEEFEALIGAEGLQ